MKLKVIAGLFCASTLAYADCTPSSTAFVVSNKSPYTAAVTIAIGDGAPRISNVPKPYPSVIRMFTQTCTPPLDTHVTFTARVDGTHLIFTVPCPVFPIQTTNVVNLVSDGQNAFCQVVSQ